MNKKGLFSNIVLIVLILVIFWVVFSLVFPRHDDDCLKNYAENYCESIEKEYAGIQNLIGYHVFLCTDYRKENEQYFFLEEELNECKNRK